MYLRFGNLTLEQFIERTGAQFTDQERAELESLRRDTAHVVGTGGFHVFSDPAVVFEIDEPVYERVTEILTASNSRQPFTRRIGIQKVTDERLLARGTFGDLEVSIHYSPSRDQYRTGKKNTTLYWRDPIIEIVGVDDAVSVLTARGMIQVSGAALPEALGAARTAMLERLRYRPAHEKDHPSTKLGAACPTCGAVGREPCRQVRWTPSFAGQTAPATSAHTARKRAALTR